MGVIPTITCRRCHRKYSGLRSRCPHCGTRKASTSGRTPSPAASANSGTGANARMADNTKWQLIFGAILLVAVIFAVIVMILLSIGDSEPIPTPTPEPVVQTPSPTIPPTPEPIIEITSAQGLVNKNVQSGWSGHIGDTNEHSIEYFPSDAIVDIEWTSSDEDVVTVEKTGAKTADVTGVGEGNATVTAVVGTEKVEFDLIIY